MQSFMLLYGLINLTFALLFLLLPVNLWKVQQYNENEWSLMHVPLTFDSFFYLDTTQACVNKGLFSLHTLK